ncbi:hypothetical protein TNIN_170621 [Trichonephila inaurata madagascariensis]|uniref:Uncharacterized protein n=1 Tax=Trichonephila inaurata madagascariensis TaxID=2747483 RepID=A0A8X6YY67_9ARAC|nr:hypothetical protein TNIN_170621 [Trichonephila inaurata madagascariensis]
MKTLMALVNVSCAYATHKYIELFAVSSHYILQVVLLDSLLAPWQKLSAIRSIILPRLDFACRNAHIQKSQTIRLNKLLIPTTKRFSISQTELSPLSFICPVVRVVRRCLGFETCWMSIPSDTRSGPSLPPKEPSECCPQETPCRARLILACRIPQRLYFGPLTVLRRYFDADKIG